MNGMEKITVLIDKLKSEVGKIKYPPPTKLSPGDWVRIISKDFLFIDNMHAEFAIVEKHSGEVMVIVSGGDLVIRQPIPVSGLQLVRGFLHPQEGDVMYFNQDRDRGCDRMHIYNSVYRCESCRLVMPREYIKKATGL